ncbi:MAG: hypothetical protein FWG89_03120 [Treponema sp.]|nr:hypothetical protein [Treponema sp.]
MLFDECKGILLKEIELIQRIETLQNTIMEAVMNREWVDFDVHFKELDGTREEFAVLEDERERLFTGGFYTFVVQFQAEQRNELTGIYRNLKLEALKVQAAGDALMGYIAGVRATLAGFFEIAFPDRGGKLYTPHGIPVSHDMRSMVLNRCF